MQITIGDTDAIITVGPGIPARLWKGHDETGETIVALVIFVHPLAHDEDTLAVFKAKVSDTRFYFSDGGG
jgi:hypothetical protein